MLIMQVNEEQCSLKHSEPEVFETEKLLVRRTTVVCQRPSLTRSPCQNLIVGELPILSNRNKNAILLSDYLLVKKLMYSAEGAQRAKGWGVALDYRQAQATGRSLG